MIQDAFVRQRAGNLLAGLSARRNITSDGNKPEHDLCVEKNATSGMKHHRQRVTQSIDARLIQLTENRIKQAVTLREIEPAADPAA